MHNIQCTIVQQAFGTHVGSMPRDLAENNVDHVTLNHIMALYCDGTILCPYSVYCIENIAQ